MVDIELRVIAGALLSPPKNVPLGDGVDQNDKPFRAQFPYVGLANDGFNSNLKRIEPPHAPVPQPPTPVVPLRCGARPSSAGPRIGPLP